MTYIVEHSTEPPYFLSGSFEDEWELRVPELKRRADISRVFRGGKRLLDPAESPASLTLSRPYKQIFDIFESYGSVVLVSAPLRDLIEEMDPGLHQFIPIFLLDIGGRPIGGPRFILNVHLEQDSIVDELSHLSVHSSATDPSIKYVEFHGKGGFKVTINRRKLGAANLWREKRYPTSLLLSDALVREIKARKLKFFKLRETTGVASA